MFFQPCHVHLVKGPERSSIQQSVQHGPKRLGGGPLCLLHREVGPAPASPPTVCLAAPVVAISAESLDGGAEVLAFVHLDRDLPDRVEALATNLIAAQLLWLSALP